MKRLIAASAVFMFAGMAVAAEPALQEGDEVSAFYVKDVTGPAAGQELCYRCRYGDRPVVSIFTRNINDDLAKLIKEVDGSVAENAGKDMAAFVVLLTDTPDTEAANLKALAEKHGIKNVPLTTFNDQTGPRSYRISKDAEVTVMMWVDGALKSNETMSVKDLTEKKIAGVLSNTSKILN